MLDVMVIGGGQAGLAAGSYLAEQGRSFAILDAGSEVGQSWRSRWDSLVLFTPAQFDSLPGMPYPARADTYPTKDDVADYLSAYVEAFELPVRLGASVTSLDRQDETYVASIGSETVEAKQVVVATGPYQAPFVPRVAAGADDPIVQMHSADYRRPDALAPGPVLVVGAGNSGCQIAGELAASRPVELAVGRRQPVVPQRPLGRDVWWWGTKVGVANATIDSRLGRRLAQRDPIIGTGPRRLSRRHRIRLRPRVDRVEGGTVTFADGSTSKPAVIVWATGFRGEYGWIHVPGVLDDAGVPVHRRGVTSAPGLYFLGLPWLWTRGSALLGWVGADASYVARRIAAPSTR